MSTRVYRVGGHVDCTACTLAYRMPVIKADVVRLIKEAAESPLEKDQLLVLAGDNTSLWSELHEEDVVTCLWACMHMEGSTRDVATKADIALLAEHIQRLVEQQQHQVTRLHAMQQAISRRKAAKAAKVLNGKRGRGSGVASHGPY
ncbi:g2207 [Coccomyxa elongata]